MKKLIWHLLVLLIANKVQAQEYKFSANTNILNLAMKGPSVAMEYRVSSHWGIQCYASAGKTNFWNVYSYKTVIFDFKRQFATYFYTGPYIRFIDKTVYRPANNSSYFSYLLDPGRDFRGQGISIGQTVGIRTLSSKRFNLDTFAGAGYGRFINQQGSRNRLGFLDIRIGVMTGINF